MDDAGPGSSHTATLNTQFAGSRNGVARPHALNAPLLTAFFMR
ncbi:hypothetical protein [Desulfosarcina ovata]|nr:hypothetical protein [Desulfosarcina ovata]